MTKGDEIMCGDKKRITPSGKKCDSKFDIHIILNEEQMKKSIKTIPRNQGSSSKQI